MPDLILVTSSYPQAEDGREAAGGFVADLARTLAAQGEQVRVIAPGDRRTVASQDGLTVHRYWAPAAPLSTLRPWRPRELLQMLRTLASGRAQLRAALRECDAPFVLALWAVPAGLWAWSLRCRYSCWVLGSDIWTWSRIPGARAVLRRVLRASIAVHADGYALGRQTEEFAGCPVDFLPSTRAIGRAPPDRRCSPPYRLLFLGRWHPNKGIDLLLDALGQLADDDWHAIESVCVAGGGPLEARVKSEVAALQARGRPVQLKGFLDKAAARQAILAADFLLIPSRIESIPVVFSDAVKLGCPVIATPVGDLPQLASISRWGHLCDAATAEAIAAAIRRATQPAREHAPYDLEAVGRIFDLDAIAAQLVQHARESAAPGTAGERRA